MTLMTKNIIYKKADYLKAVANLKKVMHETKILTHEELSNISSELLIDFNKYNFYFLDMQEIYAESVDVQEFVKKTVFQVSDAFLKFYKRMTRTEINAFKKTDSYQDLLKITENRLILFYKAYLTEDIKILTFLKLAKARNLKIEVYSSKNLDNFLGIDFTVVINDKFINVHSVNGSYKSKKYLKDKYLKTSYLQLETEVYEYDRKKEFVRQTHHNIFDYDETIDKNSAEAILKFINNRVFYLINRMNHSYNFKTYDENSEFKKNLNLLTNMKKDDVLYIYKLK